MPSKFRPGDREVVRRWAHYVIERLLDLRFETDPTDGEASANSKDLKAFQTLQHLGQLTAGLGDWAINHEIGLAAAELTFVPSVAWSGQQHRDFVAARAEVNTHRHEIAGLRAKFAESEAMKKGQEPASDPELQRRILINLLTANAAGFPRRVAAGLATALKALSYNEVHPILAPRKAGSKVTFSEVTAQLEAIAFVEYRIARGTRKEKAREQVADKFGVSPFTLRSWEKRHKRDRPFQVLQAQAWGRSAGMNDEYESENGPHSLASNYNSWEYAFGAEALREAAKRYKASRER